MEKSKQRYALQEFALVRATLIKGKSGWRIGSVETKENFYHMAVDKPARGSVVRIFRQLRRFIHGEEAAPTLFDFVVQALELVASDHTHRSFIDSTVHLHLMSLLGYVAKKDMPEAIKELDFATISNQFTESLQTDTEQLLTHAVKVSQL